MSSSEGAGGRRPLSRMGQREPEGVHISHVEIALPDDINKSLETIIAERGIIKPSKYRSLPSNVSQSAGLKVKLRKINPMTHSLAEMIEGVEKDESEPGPSGKRRIDSDNEESNLKTLKQSKNQVISLESGGKKDLMKVQKDTKPIVTPYRALNLLSEKGMLIELCIGKQKDEGGKDHLWRCIITCGEIRGVCDSMRKVVAREMASHQFLQNLIAEFDKDVCPKYVVPDELFIDPKVFHWIEKECINRALEVGHETKMIDSGFKNKAYSVCTYQCTYYVVQNEFIGISSEENYAKLNAAKRVYEFITKKTLSPTVYFLENDCDPKLEYDFNESMVCQVIGKDEFF